MNSDRQNHAPACRLEAVKNYRQPGLASRAAGKNDVDCRQAVAEAKRCLVNHPCTGCDLCRWLCPDLCISRDPDTGLLVIDYDYCKGCGICAWVCPKGAISMTAE